MSKVAEEKIAQFQSLSGDEQLGVLWFLYQDLVKDKITPEAEREGENLSQANSLIDSIKEMSQDDQLQVQKDILAGSDRQEFETYKSYSSNQKLFFWYQLALEMKQGSVVEFPSDYQLSDQGKDLLKSLKTIGFDQQLTFMRDAVGYSSDDSLN